MANDARTTYIDVTNDLERRVWEHRSDQHKGFTQRYGLTKLVHLEELESIRQAIDRRKELKAWRRPKKLALIAASNRNWEDLAGDWYD